MELSQRVVSMSAQPSYCLITYGCQMNVADSEFVAGELSARGWRHGEEVHRRYHVSMVPDEGHPLTDGTPRWTNVGQAARVRPRL